MVNGKFDGLENSKRKELTSRQEEILEYIKKYSKENRMPPTVREIGNHFEISSTNGVRSILAALIKKGYINRSPRLSRGIEVIDNDKSGNVAEAPSNTIEIPIVGRVAAGTPILAVQNLEGTVTIDRDFLACNLIPVSKTSFGQEWIQTSFGYQAAQPLSRNKIAEPHGHQQGDDFFRDRVEYYISRVIENQVHTSEKYELPRIYFLGLLDFELFPEEPQKYIHHVDEMCNGRKFFPKIQKIFVEIDKFFELEKAGVTANDNSEAAQWLRAIKVIVKEEPIPEKIMQNETFRHLLDSRLN